MSIHGKRQTHDLKPASTRTGHVIYGLALRSWALQLFHQVVNRQTRLLHRSQKAKTDSGGRPESIFDLHIHPSPRGPESGSKPLSP